VVTNITAFGCFVDVGVHQDGLVHISELADRFVKDPHDVVKVGQKVAVRVLEIDLNRKRIALSARTGAPRVSGDRPAPGQAASGAQKRDGNQPRRDAGPAQKRDGNQQRGGASGQKGGGAPQPKPAGDGKALSHNPFAAFFNKG
jgi:uncharacterized protein